MADAPVVGICAAVERASWGEWELEANVSPRVYALAVQHAGGLALILPPDDTVAEAPDELLGLLDALVIPGGSDIDPASYGARPHPETHGTRPERDRFELALAHRALEREMPLLGVCLGSQLLADAAGAPVSRCSEPEIGWHPVEVLPPGADDPLFGPLPERFDGFQWHGYGFDLPPGASALARSAACLQGYRLDGRIWGIQFHAEVSWESVKGWLADYGSDPDAVRIGLDPTRLLEESGRRIERWNQVGRGICERFLEAAEREPQSVEAQQLGIGSLIRGYQGETGIGE